MKGGGRPLGMVGRIGLVLFAALVLELLGNVALHRWENRGYVTEADTKRIAAQLVAADRLVMATPPKERTRRVAELGGEGLALNWVPRTVMTDYSASLDGLAATKAQLIAAAPELGGRGLRLSILPAQDARRRDLFGAMALSDGSFVTFRVSPYLAAPPSAWLTTAVHLLLVGMVMLIALLMIRALVGPLRELADAADATQLGQAPAVRIAGPSEVRRVAAAFAAMQARLLRTMEDHTQSLVAVSHDLRTPIQRLRLRAALIDDREMQAAITQDLIEMEHFIAATLAYVREDKEEAARLVDVAAIASSAVDDAADAGADIALSGCDELVVSTRPIAFKRLLGNLIDNAIRHGEQVTVMLEVVADGFAISVEDDGPGIPVALRAEALLPFRRLEHDGARTEGGAGLGLAIADKAARAMGGALVLDESAMGGLRVRVVLPGAGALLPL